MSRIKIEEIRAILIGVEHAGDATALYRVVYPVPADLLGQSEGGNTSGFQFGIADFDIGNDDYGSFAYLDILSDALSAGAIDTQQFDRLMTYRDNTRYDLDPSLASTYEADLALLNAAVFSQQGARDIVEVYNSAYIENHVLGPVTTFLDTMAAVWGTDSVFDYQNADYHEAVAAVTLVAYRTGSLADKLDTFLVNQPDTLDEVEAWFNSFPETNGEWPLVLQGGDAYHGIDVRYTGVAQATSLTDAMALYGLDSASDIVEIFLKSQIGNGIENVSYTGSDEAAFLISDFNISGTLSASGGILLSSGEMPPFENTASGFGNDNDTDGDEDLTKTAEAAFDGAGTTNDAAVIEFTLKNPDGQFNGVAFDIVFGSDEYPEYSDSSFVDIAAIYVNGVNVALFNDNPLTPLSVIDENLETGNFIDNTSGAFGIEWDGFSRFLAVRAPLAVGANEIKIAIADTGDSILDSGLYINNLELLENGATGGGVLTVVNGTSGDDVLTGTVNLDEINLFEGADIVQGTFELLSKDIITGFGTDDALKILDSSFSTANLLTFPGLPALYFDVNGDGELDADVDAVISIEGDYGDGQFLAFNAGNDTYVSFNRDLPTFTPGEAVDPGAVNGVNNAFLAGTGSRDFEVALKDLGFAGYDNVVGVYEVDADGNIVDVQIVFDNANADKGTGTVITNVEDGNTLGFFLVQDAADWAAMLAPGDVLSFINGVGEDATLADGADIHLAVNGVDAGQTVFHSFAADMNADGVQHALSGIDQDGAMTVGFEDLVGGGDQDYEDVVFSVAHVDEPII